MKYINTERTSAKSTGLADLIVALDLENMKEIFKELKQKPPIDRRMKSFDLPGKIITAMNDNELVGYIEYGDSWENKSDIYISSVQISKKYRASRVFYELTNMVKDDLKSVSNTRIYTHVQKNNELAIRLFKKLGFIIIEPKQGTDSFIAEYKTKTA